MRATEDIVKLVKTVQEGTSQAVSSIEDGAREVETGSEVAARAGSALESIGRAVDLTWLRISEISKIAMELAEHSAAAEEGMSAVMEVAEQNSASAEEMR